MPGNASGWLPGIFLLALLSATVACAAPTPALVPPTPTLNSPTSVATVSAPTRIPASATVPPSPRTPTIAARLTASPTPPDCPILPVGSFNTIWEGDPGLKAALSCPSSLHPRILPDAWQVKTSYQPFEHGAMLWSNQLGWYTSPVIYVLYADSTYQRLEDRFDPTTDAERGTDKPPSGLIEPTMGFGKVWRDEPNVRTRLGWATASETPGTGRFELFLLGEMAWITQTNQTYAFIRDSGKARVFNIPFSDR